MKKFETKERKKAQIHFLLRKRKKIKETEKLWIREPHFNFSIFDFSLSFLVECSRLSILPICIQIKLFMIGENLSKMRMINAWKQFFFTSFWFLFLHRNYCPLKYFANFAPFCLSWLVFLNFDYIFYFFFNFTI